MKAKKARETKIRECYQDIDSSRLIITKLINDHSLAQSMRLCPRETAFSTLQHIINAIGVYFEWSSWVKPVPNFTDLYKQLGYNEKEAKLKATELQFKLRAKKPSASVVSFCS